MKILVAATIDKHLRKYLKIEIFLVLWLIPSFILIKNIHKIKQEKICEEIILTEDDYVKSFNFCAQIINGTKRVEHACHIFSTSSIYGALDPWKIPVGHAAFIPTHNLGQIQDETTLMPETTTTPKPTAYPEYWRYGDHFCNIALKVDEKQKKMETGFNYITIGIKIVIVLLAGAWVDKRISLNLVMTLPLIGQCLGLLIMLVFNEFVEGPIAIGYGTAEIVRAIFGDQEMMMIGIYCYLTWTTKEEDRTFRFAFIPLLTTKLLSDALAGDTQTFKIFNNFQSKTVVFALPIVGCVLGIIFLRYLLSDPVFQKQLDDIEKSDGIKRYPCDVWQSYKRLVKDRRTDNQKWILRSLFVAFFLCICPIFIESEFFDSFIRNNQLTEHYEEIKKYDVLVSVIFGTTALVTCLTKFAKCPDTIIAIVSVFLSIVSKPVLANITNVTTISVIRQGYAIDCLKRGRTIATRSFISKIVKPSELGRSFALLSVIFLVAQYFVKIFIEIISLDELNNSIPGIVFMTSESFLIPALIIFSMILKKSSEFNEEEINEEILKNSDFLRTVCCNIIKENLKEQLKPLLVIEEDKEEDKKNGTDKKEIDKKGYDKKDNNKMESFTIIDTEAQDDSKEKKKVTRM